MSIATCLFFSSSAAADSSRAFRSRSASSRSCPKSERMESRTDSLFCGFRRGSRQGAHMETCRRAARDTNACIRAEDGSNAVHSAWVVGIYASQAQRSQ
eukprot:539593-Pleurochrysis_carterae.AAC.1